MSDYKLLSVGADAKTIKGNGDEYMTAILYMKSYKTFIEELGKTVNPCAFAEQASCHEGCLVSAGRGKMNSVQSARERKLIQFYDYTKIYTRVYKDLPSNYHLTLSYSEASMDYAKKINLACADTNTSMAVVFEGDLPICFLGRKVIDGDTDDLRFLDPTNVVVGLKAKGDARHDTSGFVIRKVA